MGTELFDPWLEITLNFYVLVGNPKGNGITDPSREKSFPPTWRKACWKLSWACPTLVLREPPGLDS